MCHPYIESTTALSEIQKKASDGIQPTKKKQNKRVVTSDLDYDVNL